MGKHILLIQGFADTSQSNIGHTLENAHAQGSAQAIRDIKRIDAAMLGFPLLRGQDD